MIVPVPSPAVEFMQSVHTFTKAVLPGQDKIFKWEPLENCLTCSKGYSCYFIALAYILFFTVLFFLGLKCTKQLPLPPTKKSLKF